METSEKVPKHLRTQCSQSPLPGAWPGPDVIINVLLHPTALMELRTPAIHEAIGDLATVKTLVKDHLGMETTLL